MALIGPSVGVAQRHHEVTLQTYQDIDTDTGFPIEDFVDVATVMAARQPVMMQGSAERFSEDIISARNFDRWTLPYLDAFDPDVLPVAKMRLVYLERPYDILEAHVINMRAEIVLTTMVKAA